MTPSDEGSADHWLRTIKAMDGADLTVEVDGARREGTPSRPAVRDASGRRRRSGTRPGIGRGFLHKIKEIEFGPDGTVIVAPNMMTGRPGIFAGGDLIRANARSPLPSAAARRRRVTSMRGSARWRTHRRPNTRSSPSACSICRFSATCWCICSANSWWKNERRLSKKSLLVWTSRRQSEKRSAASRAATVTNATTAWRRVLKMRLSSWARTKGTMLISSAAPVAGYASLNVRVMQWK